MTTLAQELVILAKKKRAEDTYVDQIIDYIFNLTINHIKLHRCYWDEKFTNVTVNINLDVKEPLIEYVEFYYTITSLFKNSLANKFETAGCGFKLRTINLIEGQSVIGSITLDV